MTLDADRLRDGIDSQYAGLLASYAASAYRSVVKNGLLQAIANAIVTELTTYIAIVAGRIDSEAAAAGKVLTADGASGASWQSLPAGITTHNALGAASLVWTASAHTGTASRLAYFDAGGAASYVDPTVFALSGHVHTGVYQPYSATLDTYAANALTAVEIQQLQNIGATTITAGQWTYLGGMNQALATTDSPQFVNVTSGQDFHVGRYVRGASDANTLINFVGGDEMRLVAGGVEFIRLSEAVSSELILNQGGVDIDLTVYSNGSVRAFFVQGSDGHVAIGPTASPHASSWLYIAENTASESVVRLENNAAGTVARVLHLGMPNYNNPGTNDDYIQFADQGPAETGRINGDGAGGVQYNSTSDRRLKKDIQELTAGFLTRLDRLPIVEFTWKKSGRQAIGMIAQDVWEAWPDATQDPEEIEEERTRIHERNLQRAAKRRENRAREARNALRVDGEPAEELEEVSPDEPDRFMAVDHGRLAVLALGAIKELREEVRVLRAEIDTLRRGR